MSDPLDKLKGHWKEAKNTQQGTITNPGDLIALAQHKMRRAKIMQAQNIAVLSVTLIGISAFFYFLAPLQESLSHLGIFLMLGGLFIRIVIESYSIHRSGQQDLSDSTVRANEKAMQFYSFRKQIHGPVTIVILVAYTIGFYLLTPEFSKYMTTTQTVLMDISYLVAAAIFGYSIRKGIKDEMRILDEWTKIREAIKEK